MDTTHRLWACILTSVKAFSAITLFGLMAVQSASAQELPTSIYPAIGAPWTTMQAGSYESKPASARAQCEHVAEQSVSDALTSTECQRFESMLAAGQCDSVQVPDGIVHDYVNYKRPNGQEFVSVGVLKEHGSGTAAFLCDLGGGVFGYFYAGSPKHCNNAAFVFIPSPPPLTQNCEFVSRGVEQQPSTYVSLPGLYSSGIYVPGVDVFVQGGLQHSSRTVCK